MKEKDITNKKRITNKINIQHFIIYQEKKMDLSK